MYLYRWINKYTKMLGIRLEIYFKLRHLWSAVIGPHLILEYGTLFFDRD